MLAFGRGRSVAVRISPQFWLCGESISTNAFRWFESGYRPENRTEGKPSVQKCIYKILKNFRETLINVSLAKIFKK